MVGSVSFFRVFLHSALPIVRSLHHLSKTLSPFLWQGCVNTLVGQCSSTSRLNAKMLRKKSRAVPEGNGHIAQDAYVMPGGITREELRRVMSETMGIALKEFREVTREVNQRLASLEQVARQPRLAMEADITADEKTRKRTEGAAAAVQAKCGKSCSAKSVQTGPKSSTSFDMKAEPPAFPHRNDVMVDIGAAAPKLCLSPVEMRTLTAISGLLPACKTSTATMTIFQQLPLGFCLTKKIKSRTSNQYAMDNSSLWKLKIIETKSGQTLVFDPGSSTGHRCACPFLRTWRTLLCREVFVRALNETAAFWGR